MRLAAWWLSLLATASLCLSSSLEHQLNLIVPTIHDLKIQSLRNRQNVHSNGYNGVSFPEHNLSVPVDHFHNDSRYEPHSNESFNLRYWFNADHYGPNGPVFVIAAGETSGTNRFPLLYSGIIAELCRRYHGIGVILEHRYYGTSFPVANLSTPSLRFLTTDQAMADYAYFANHVTFPGLGHLNLTALSGDTPWIAYGGSYAGAFVAFLRKLYPETYYGAICSSGVTEAVIDYWEYYEAIRLYAPAKCVATLQTMIGIVDDILIGKKNQTLTGELRSAFGVRGELDDQEFASRLTYGLGTFQYRNWDPDVASPVSKNLCGNISSDVVLNPPSDDIVKNVKRIITAAGHPATNSSIVTGMLNWISFLRLSFGRASISTSHEDESYLLFSTPANQPHLFPYLDPQAATPPTLNEGYLSWYYQTCTQWGFFKTGSGVPSSISPLVSRTLDLAYASSNCKFYFNISSPPKVEEINKHGGHNFSYPRVAIIDGLADPWRAATPHVIGAPERETRGKKGDEEPWWLIDVPEGDVWDGIRGGGHHWDQNGVFAPISRRAHAERKEELKIPPKAIDEVHHEILRFVGVWLQWWKEGKQKKMVESVVQTTEWREKGQEVIGVLRD